MSSVQDGTVPRALHPFESTKAYLGLNRLKALVQSEGFVNYWLSECNLKNDNSLEWYELMAKAVEFLLSRQGRFKVTPQNPGHYKQMFQETKLCSAETAAKTIALVRAFKGEEKPNTKWDERYSAYKTDDRIFKKYFRYAKQSQKPLSLEPDMLHGSWAVYITKNGTIFRSWLRLDMDSKDHLYYITPDQLRLTHCQLYSNRENQSVKLTGQLEYSDWHYTFNAKYATLEDHQTWHLMQGMANITNNNLIQHSVVLLVRLSEELTFPDNAHWKKLNPYNYSASYKGENKLLSYFQHLLDSSAHRQSVLPQPTLSRWLKKQFNENGRTKYDQYKKVLSGTQWVSLSRKPDEVETIRIYEWHFRYHDLRNAIYVIRKRKEALFDTEVDFEGEMKFYHERFWIEFSSESQHKIMFLRPNDEEITDGIYFLGMGSSTLTDHQRDLGDMVTEILLPLKKLPKEYHGQASMKYKDFRKIDSIPLDFKLYLNHRDHNILSFDNPDSIKSKLSKQKEAILFEGKYLIYTYNRFFPEDKKVSRSYLVIDNLSVTTFRKQYRSKPKDIHLFKGLAEAFNDNLHIILEYERVEGHPSGDHKPQEEVQLMIDSSPAHGDLSVLSGVMADTDRQSNPRSMACVAIKVDNPGPEWQNQLTNSWDDADPNAKRQIPAPYCAKGSSEYNALNDLLWSRQQNHFQKTFGTYIKNSPVNKEHFLETYFEMMGGVFFTTVAEDS